MTTPRNHNVTTRAALEALAAATGAPIELPVGAGWATCDSRQGRYAAWVDAPNHTAALAAVASAGAVVR